MLYNTYRMEDYSGNTNDVLAIDQGFGPEKIQDEVRTATARILTRDSEALTGQYDLIRKSVIETILKKDQTGGVILQYDALGMPFLADDSHAVPKGVRVLEVQTSGSCGYPNRVDLPPRSSLSSYITGQVRQLPEKMRNPYTTTAHEVAHTTNSYGRNKNGKVTQRRMRWNLQNIVDLAIRTDPQYQQMAHRVTVETHSILTEKWLHGALADQESLDDP